VWVDATDLFSCSLAIITVIINFDCRELDEFEKGSSDPDVINLRYKHYQARLIDTINMVLEERKKIKMEQQRAEARGGMVSPVP